MTSGGWFRLTFMESPQVALFYFMSCLICIVPETVCIFGGLDAKKIIIRI